MRLEPTAAKDSFSSLFAPSKSFAPSINWVESYDASPPLPPNCPMFLEPNHYYTSHGLDAVCAAIMRCGRHIGADLETQSDETFSYHFVAYANHSEISFAINVYADDQSRDARFILEIQRLSVRCSCIR